MILTINVADSSGVAFVRIVLRFDLVTELLKGLEGEKPIGETLTSTEKLFIKDLSDKIIIESRQRITDLKQSYSQQKIKYYEAKTEISNILIRLT